MVPSSGVRQSRLAWRLFALFVAVALLPLALSDWLTSSAVSQLIEQLQVRSQTQTTHQVSLQVFDRLLAGKALLAAAPADASASAVPGWQRVFSTVTRIAPGGGAADAASARLVAAWQAAGAGRPVPRSLMDPNAAVTISLRVETRPHQPARVWLGASDHGALRRIAQFDPAYLWAPLSDADDGGDWTVHDEQGTLLATQGGSDAPAKPGARRLMSSARLFLGAEFGAADWVFIQHSPLPEARWQGLPLMGWLVLVGAGTLLSIALLSLWQIRRTLVPLQQLTEGTRQLAAGVSQTRVVVRGHDELGVLAQAFNDMAGRIEGQLHELAHRAAHDSLTGLANRRALHDRLDALLATPQATGVAVLFVDLDHFKDINDGLGHEAGDELLCQAGERLRACVPSGAVVARQGGDEFVLVLPGSDENAACAVARDVVRRLGQPFSVRGGHHLLGASVGVALAPLHGRTRDDILRCADIAMYAAKSAGRGQFAVFSSALDAAARDRVRLQGELRHALEHGEFVVYYQPRISPVDGRISSAEALVRWQHPDRGLLLPGEFIAMAEESTLIEDLGAWVLDEACAQMARWRRQGVHLRRLSVNVSPRQLTSGNLPEQVWATLSRHALPAEALELEMTESSLVGNAREACAQLTELRNRGVSIALDDFGTGYSSMAALRQLPIDVMKIDRAFVKDIGQHGSDGDGALAIIRAIVAMAQSLHLLLVAEGVESEAQAAVLKEMGCNEFQGFLYSEPLAAGLFALQPGLLRLQS